MDGARAARTNLNVVDLVRYDDYKKRLLADGNDRANLADALRSYISITAKVEDEVCIYGSLLLGLTAFALFAFGLFQCSEAMWRRIEVPKVRHVAEEMG